MLARHLKAEAHQHRGGHQAEVQADLEKLSATTQRWLLQTLREKRNTINRAKRHLWRMSL